MKFNVLAILIACFSLSAFSQEESRLLRFPAIHGDQVVFTYAGDLFTVKKSGGVARKLTSDIGYEMFAHFSPNGKTVAFSGQYDGNTEIYTMPANGGSPKRVTHTATLGRDDISDRMGPNNIVMTWKDNQEIVFRSRMREFNSFKGQLYSVNIDGDIPEQLPVPTGGWCSFSPDGKKMAYNQIFRTFRTWKYYKGGMAPEVWIFDNETKSCENVTNNDAQDIFPMWHGDKIYFISDRDRIMNLFVYNTTTKETSKLTNFTDYDIKFPNLGDKAIIFEKGGFLFTFDLTTNEVAKISVIIKNDEIYSRDKIVDASKQINSWDISPKGKRFVFGARGDIFTVPAKTGITRDLTKTSNAHDRNATWSPDGKHIAFVSDQNGEDEIYIIPQNGKGETIQLTNTADTYKYEILWSPDSKKIAWADQMKRIRYVDVATKKITEVAHIPVNDLRDFSWSPDSRWITYTHPVENGASFIEVYNLENAKTHRITDNWYDVGNPTFDNNGKYLFFTSQRNFNPTYNWLEWNHAYTDLTKIYFVTLQKSTLSPFAPVNDEEIEKESDDDEKDKEESKDEKDNFEVVIDFDNIENRVMDIPLPAGSYWNLTTLDDVVYFNSYKKGDKSSKLMLYNLKNQKSKELGESLGYTISANHKKMAVSKKGKFAVIDTPKGKINVEKWADLSNMEIKVNVEQEWQQIYDESWRQMRDFFYDENMHGNDWQAVYDKYNPLVSCVKNRHDLNYVIGEMIGELNCGHAYVNGGDCPMPKRVKTGLLGAKLSRDKSGFYKIEKILKGENWKKSNKSPLTRVGVNISEGDYIIAINGVSVAESTDIYEMLVNNSNKQVEITINSKPKEAGSHIEIIEPIADESKLYYYNWVQENIEKVNKATNGEVGYIHIPDMGPGGLTEFVKHFYPQLNKRALIIDDRGNGGGNVSPMIIERLRRELTMMGQARNGTSSTKPNGMLYGPKVLLLNEYSASDGDLFPYQFKTLKLGKLIGRRSWGGVVGIRGSLPFIDGGQMTRPEFAHYDKDGTEFIIEGYGVDPDIEVFNDPYKEFSGEDQQLNKAIEVILEELKDWPKDLPQTPPFPDKSK